MKEVGFNNITFYIEKIFSIIKEEYGDFLNQDQRDFLTNLDYSKFLKYSKDFPNPYLSLTNDFYYINDNSFNISKLIFMCLAILCGNITPLKTGLILIEVNNIISKYNLGVNDNEYQSIEVAKIVKSSLLKELPFNIIFFESDIEISNYLVLEKGIQVAKFYYEISDMLNSIVIKDNFNPFQYLEISSSYNYDSIYDKLYDFINSKVI